MSPELKPFTTVTRKAILPVLFLSGFWLLGYGVSDNAKKDDKIRQAVWDLQSCIGIIKVINQPWDLCGQITHVQYPETPEQFEVRLRQEQTPREIKNLLAMTAGTLMFVVPVSLVVGKMAEESEVK